MTPSDKAVPLMTPDRIEASGSAYIKLDGPQGPSYILSETKDEISVGELNIGNNENLELHAKGSVEISTLNIGTDAILADHFGNEIGTFGPSNSLFAGSAILLSCLLMSVVIYRILSARK